MKASVVGDLGVELHGVTLRLGSNHPPLLEYAAEHLDGLLQAPVSRPDIEVNCWWFDDDAVSEVHPFTSHGAINIIGKRMMGSQDELIWLDTLRMKGLQLRFRQQDGRFFFDVVYRLQLKKDKLERSPEYVYKRYFSLMSYAVYYPIFWYLEHFHHWTILHASALAHGPVGIVIGGLGGVGKTTTCVALMQCQDINLIAENLIFTDGNFIYPCPEPIRLDDNSLALLNSHPRGLTPMCFPDGLKDKSLFHLASQTPADKVTPAVLFLPQFSPRRYITPLVSEIAAEKMIAMNRLTRELDDYGWYAAALDMTWSQPGLASRRVQVISHFTEHVRCFELGIDRSAGIQAVLDDILRVVSG